METMLLRERYKVVRILWSQPDYALDGPVEEGDSQIIIRNNETDGWPTHERNALGVCATMGQ